MSPFIPSPFQARLIYQCITDLIIVSQVCICLFQKTGSTTLLNNPTKVSFTIQSSQDTFSENSGHSRSNAIQSVIFRTPCSVKANQTGQNLQQLALTHGLYHLPRSCHCPDLLLHFRQHCHSTAISSLAQNPVGFFLTPGMS